MKYILINRTRTDLSAADYEKLGQLAQEFYDHVPAGITLLGDWAANDRSRTFTLLETEDERLIDKIQQPFRGYVDIEVIPVTAVSGWGQKDG